MSTGEYAGVQAIRTPRTVLKWGASVVWKGNGNTAVVTGRVTQKGTENGKDISRENRFTRVYVKEKGRWLSAALQEPRRKAVEKAEA